MSSPGRPPKPYHQCKLVGSPEYGLGPAATVSLNRPCTNRPFKCPKCDLYGWTYSLGKHFQLKHAGAEVPAEALLGTHEEEWVKLVGTGKPGQRSAPSTGARARRKGGWL